MKIVQLVFELAPGGGEKFVVNLSNQLVALGHDVTVMQLRNDETGIDIHFNRQFLADRVNYVNLNLTKGFTFGKAIKVMKAITKINPDVVHTHLNVLPYIYPLTILKPSIKFVHTLHNIASKECSNSLQRKLNRLFYIRHLITPVTISNECRQSFIETYRLPSPSMILNGGVEIHPSPDFDKTKAEIASYKCSEKSKVFIHVARFNVQKYQDLLIDSFNKLDAEGIDFTLLVLGLYFNSEQAKPLVSRACKKIHFLGVRPNVGDYLLASDAFVLSSKWEGLPISILEAMAASLPTISTRAGGVPSIIADGLNGYLSPAIEVNAFVATIKRFIESPLPSEPIYRLFKEKYSMEACCDEYLKVYNAK